MSVKDILKGIARIVLYFVIFIVVIFGIGIVHELGHGFTAMIFGGRFDAIVIVLNNFEDSNVSMHVLVSVEEETHMFFVLISGIIAAVLVSTIMILVVFHYERFWYVLPFYLNILNELIYWCISPSFGRGDGYILVNLLNIDLITYYAYVITIAVVYLSVLSLLILRKLIKQTSYMI